MHSYHEHYTRPSHHLINGRLYRDYHQQLYWTNNVTGSYGLMHAAQYSWFPCHIQCIMGNFFPCTFAAWTTFSTLLKDAFNRHAIFSVDLELFWDSERYENAWLEHRVSEGDDAIFWRWNYVWAITFRRRQRHIWGEFTGEHTKYAMLVKIHRNSWKFSITNKKIIKMIKWDGFTTYIFIGNIWIDVKLIIS